MRRVAWGIVVAVMLGVAPSVHAQQEIVLREVLGSWRGDQTLQFVELLMTKDFQNLLSGRAALVFEGATGTSPATLLFTKNLSLGVAGASVLVATARLGDFVGLTPDILLPEGLLGPGGGRICYQAASALGGFSTVDCLAYGSYTGSNDAYGRPVRATPENRSLDRVNDTGINRDDWHGELSPTPRINDGTGRTMVTQCGNGTIDLGEQCDGDQLDGETCRSLGYVRGKLRCGQCRFNTSKCTLCGNDELNDGEQCDGAEPGDEVCEDLGFTAGNLSCTEECQYDTAGCSATFYVPGSGLKSEDCLVEWLVENEAGKPGATGKAKPVQKCAQGDGGCDFDQDPATCTFRVAVCFRLTDARLPKCVPGPVDTWELRRPLLEAGSVAGVLLDAVAALGGTRNETTVTFSPALDAGSPCTGTVSLVVPAKRKLKIKARAGRGAADTDQLTLNCRP